MPREFNPNLYPPDGYIFTDRDGTRHVAHSWKGLEKKVKAYREVNHHEPGNPWQEIQDQQCAKVPGHCRENGPVQVIEGKHGIPSFNQRVLEWYNQMLQRFRAKTLNRVDPSEAARRADICRRCPRQRSLNEACYACTLGVTTASKAIMKGGPSKHQNLLCCEALGEDCRVSVYFDQPPSEQADLPGHCWRRKK